MTDLEVKGSGLRSVLEFGFLSSLLEVGVQLP